MKKFIFFMLLTCSNFSKANYEYWELKYPDKTVLIDFKTMVVNGNYRKSWHSVNFKSAQKVKGVAFQSYTSLFLFDCSSRRFKLIKANFYSGDNMTGEIVIKENNSEDQVKKNNWQEIDPTRLIDKVYEDTCSYK